MTIRLIKYVLFLLPVALSGCVTLVDDSVMGEQRADADSVKVEVGKLVDKVSEMKQELATLKDELQSIRNAQGDESKADKKRLDDVERGLKAVEASNDKLRQEVIDELTKKIEKLLSSQPGKSSSKAVIPKGDKKAVERGYEHVVKAGEFLSEIAKAYNVTPSAIIKANSLSNPNSLRVGQKLFIPE